MLCFPKSYFANWFLSLLYSSTSTSFAQPSGISLSHGNILAHFDRFFQLSNIIMKVLPWYSTIEYENFSWMHIFADLKEAYIADSESSSIRALDLKTGGSRLLAGGDPVFSDNLFRVLCL